MKTKQQTDNNDKNVCASVATVGGVESFFPVKVSVAAFFAVSLSSFGLGMRSRGAANGFKLSEK